MTMIRLLYTLWIIPWVFIIQRNWSPRYCLLYSFSLFYGRWLGSLATFAFSFPLFRAQNDWIKPKKLGRHNSMLTMAMSSQASRKKANVRKASHNIRKSVLDMTNKVHSEISEMADKFHGASPKIMQARRKSLSDAAKQVSFSDTIFPVFLLRWAALLFTHFNFIRYDALFVGKVRNLWWASGSVRQLA